MRYFYRSPATDWRETDEIGYCLAVAALNLSMRSGATDGWGVMICDEVPTMAEVCDA